MTGGPDADRKNGAPRAPGLLEQLVRILASSGAEAVVLRPDACPQTRRGGAFTDIAGQPATTRSAIAQLIQPSGLLHQVLQDDRGRVFERTVPGPGGQRLKLSVARTGRDLYCAVSNAEPPPPGEPSPDIAFDPEPGSSDPRCGICAAGLVAGAVDLCQCVRCHSVVHGECWVFNERRCPAFACGSTTVFGHVTLQEAHARMHAEDDEVRADESPDDRRRGQDRRTPAFRFARCEPCKLTLRFPSGRGRLRIYCPRCGKSQVHDSSRA